MWKKPDVISLPAPKELFATIIHPKIELRTADARSVLKKSIPLDKAIQQWGNLAALVSGLYTDDYDLIARSLVDVVIEPERSVLIPHFNELKSTALSAGALGEEYQAQALLYFLFLRRRNCRKSSSSAG